MKKNAKGNNSTDKFKKVKKSPKNQWLKWLGVIIILGLIFVTFTYFKNRNNTIDSKIPKDILELADENGVIKITVLNAEVIWSADVFRVANLEDRSWEKCTFELNRGDSKNVFSFQQDLVDARSQLDINHSEFKNNVGESYNYQQIEPEAFLIRCANVNGRVGLYNGSPR